MKSGGAGCLWEACCSNCLPEVFSKMGACRSLCACRRLLNAVACWRLSLMQTSCVRHCVCGRPSRCSVTAGGLAECGLDAAGLVPAKASECSCLPEAFPDAAASSRPCDWRKPCPIQLPVGGQDVRLHSHCVGRSLAECRLTAWRPYWAKSGFPKPFAFGRPFRASACRSPCSMWLPAGGLVPAGRLLQCSCLLEAC